MKKVQIIFANDEYNYVTSVNNNASNQQIKDYFVGQFLTMSDGTEQQVLKVRFKYNVIAGSFIGQSGFLDPFQKWAFMPMLRIENGNQLAVSMSQLEQVV
jgi:hypothetical protein